MTVFKNNTSLLNMVPAIASQLFTPLTFIFKTFHDVGYIWLENNYSNGFRQYDDNIWILLQSLNRKNSDLKCVILIKNH